MMLLHKIIYLFICICIYYTNAASPIDEVMDKLIKLISEEQILEPVKFRFPIWEKQLGLYRSEIRLDFFGKPYEADLRKNKYIYVFDNNMFATGWISAVLLEANMYGRAPLTIDNEHLSIAIDAIEKFHDHNQNESSVPLMTFWSQVYNQTTDTWQSAPDNLRYLITDFDKNLEVIEVILKALGIKNIAELIDKLRTSSAQFKDVFEIPPDFDDTYLNIGLGVQLKLLQDKYPSIYSRWLQTNSNMKKLIDLTLQYAYRPFSQDSDKNTIDPRTYYWLRDFIRDNPQAIIVTTWAQNLTEVKKIAHRGIRMPFNLNNVDVTVSANVLYGITSAIIYDLLDFKNYFTQDMETLYLSTGSLIAWSIKNSMKDRPDLAQVYYPSHYNFLWYGSRSLFLLELARHQNKSLPDVLNRVYTVLSDVYRNDVVKYFQEHVRLDKSSYDDFLGTNDTNLFDKLEPTGEDRIFSTAQTVNVLISSFTYLDNATGKLKWINDRQIETIQIMVNKSISWLLENVFKYQPFNCFFSGSVKGFNQLPFWYPANIYQFLNGTTFDPNHFDINNESLVDAIVGVSGYINETTYQRMISEKHFNVSTPTIFNGYNVPGGEFPFWSSQPYTYSVTLLALAQYNNLDK
ncbi:unnamed protein product [Adineta steineri]|uniref:Uncharacterized protein n=1 Tax=Adineta steineri TaxID=433720 RepID=A0A814Z4K0_9BILA|nr:unnamed protein product [Adineta steineri]CAF1597620.1 unnamed protein product [Adineta steineri]